MVEDNKHYVYLVTVDGVVRYIGSGKGLRYMHGNSGISSCLELNKAFFEGKYVVTNIVYKGLSRQYSLIVEAQIINSYDKVNLYNKQYNKTLTTINTDLSKGCGVLVTTQEILYIIEHWLDNGRGCVSSSIQYVDSLRSCKDNHTLRGVAWCSAIENTTRFGDQLKQAILLSQHTFMSMLRNHRLFDIDIIAFATQSLTWRIRRLNDILEIEEKILRLETENALFRTTMKIPSELTGWKLEAIRLLYSGKKQQEVADIVGKSLITIKRLAKSQKEQNV